MQGGAKISDHNTAPVWFLQFFIKARFKDLAASKRVDIAVFNKKTRLISIVSKPIKIVVVVIVIVVVKTPT